MTDDRLPIPDALRMIVLIDAMAWAAIFGVVWLIAQVLT